MVCVLTNHSEVPFQSLRRMNVVLVDALNQFTREVIA